MRAEGSVHSIGAVIIGAVINVRAPTPKCARIIDYRLVPIPNTDQLPPTKRHSTIVRGVDAVLYGVLRTVWPERTLKKRKKREEKKCLQSHLHHRFHPSCTQPLRTKKLKEGI